jgi:hypothetical protein
MRSIKLFFAALIIFCGLIPHIAYGQNFEKDLSISADSIRTDSGALVGKNIRIYATVNNNSKYDLSGVVKFYDESKKTFIGSDQPISALAGKTDDVFVDWTGDSIGSHTISVRIIPWSEVGDDSSNNKVSKDIYVDKDSDGDGTGDRNDADDDNDGIPDAKDAFPLDPAESLDTDGDGIGDNADTDDDNDGISDIVDIFPLNAKESKDGDGDGVGDNSDPFPADPREWADTDNDGTGDNSDPDNANHSPIPQIETKSNVVAKGAIITFSALKSNDPDGQVVNYEWDFGDGKKRNEVIVDYTFDKTGEYAVKLKVTDDKGESKEQIIKISVIHRWQTIALIAVTSLAILLIAGRWLFYFSKMKKDDSKKKKGLPKRKK